MLPAIRHFPASACCLEHNCKSATTGPAARAQGQHLSARLRTVGCPVKEVERAVWRRSKPRPYPPWRDGPGGAECFPCGGVGAEGKQTCGGQQQRADWFEMTHLIIDPRTREGHTIA